MKTFDELQYLMTDGLSLQTYRHGKGVSVAELHNNLLEQMRHSCHGVPELYYYGEDNCQVWKGYDRLRDIFTKALPNLSAGYLEEDGNLICLKKEKSNDWQMLVQLMTPLLLVSSFVFSKHPVNIKKNPQVRDFLLSNSKNTVLPGVRKNVLDKIDPTGMRDMHLHLNASMEADRAVLNLMRNPRLILQDSKRLAVNSIQSCGYVNREEINTDIHRLCFLENLLARMVLSGVLVKEEDLNCVKNPGFEYDRTDEILGLFGKFGEETITDLQFESLLIHRILYGLMTEKGVALTLLEKAFHVYLLLYGRLRSFAVMQQGDAGLMGFNRYLGYDIRESQHVVSLDDLRQLTGNTRQHIRYIDLRLGVNDSVCKRLKQIEQEFETENKPDTTKFAHVALIAKEKETKVDRLRNSYLRHNIKNLFLPSLLSEDMKSMFCAVDVAGRDYEVRPDVFAPFFTELRNAGYKHFTYHAGEDFYHLLGGLRAIYEVVEFLKFDNGCRIGHACAAGVAPHLWSDMLAGEVKMKKGEYLDDLVFTHHFIHTQKLHLPKKSKSLLRKRIESLAKEVYGRPCSVDDLVNSWLKRAEDPDSIVGDYRDPVYRLVIDYHNIDVRKMYDSEIVVSCYEILSETYMIRMQKAILGLLASKGIAIEVMPTSNVYIGLHQSFHSYHLKQWIDWKYCKRYKMRMPEIVIGSDEPGILCTNIMIEYAHVQNMLESADDMLLSKKMIPYVLQKMATGANYEFI